MAYGFVQQIAGQNSAAGSSIATGAFGGAIASHSALAWLLTYYDPSNVVTAATVTRTGDTPVQVGSTGSPGVKYSWGYIQNAATTTNQLSCTFFGGSPTFRGLYAAEYSGLVYSGTIYTTGQTAAQGLASPTTAADAATSGAFSVASGDVPGVLIGFCNNANSSTDVPAAGTGFTARSTVWTGMTEAMRPEDKRITSAASLAATFTAAANTSHFMAAMFLRELVTSNAGGAARNYYSGR